jgi:hypothetical protein
VLSAHWTFEAGRMHIGSLWRYVVKLLRLRLVIFRSNFRRSKTGAKIGTILLFLLLLAGVALAFYLSSSRCSATLPPS